MATYCFFSAEISFQSGNFRHLSFRNQKQNPTVRLYLMAPQDTQARVILSYVITACLHTLSLCLSRVFFCPVPVPEYPKVTVFSWWVDKTLLAVIKPMCWRPGSEERVCRAQQAHPSTMWSSVSQVFSDPSAQRGQRQVLPPNALWAGLWLEGQL